MTYLIVMDRIGSLLRNGNEMVRFATLFIIILIGLVSPCYGEMYKWVDEKGTVHFTDDLSKIPEKYRPDAETRKPPTEISAPEMKDKSISSPPSKVPKPFGSEGAAVDLFRKGEVWTTEVLLNGRAQRHLIVDSGPLYLDQSPDSKGAGHYDQ